MADAHDEPSGVAAEKGDVHVDGPGNIVYSMTPEAAAETSERLLAGATMAQGQRVQTARRAVERRQP